MSRVIHVFRQPERFVAGTVGEPGDRSFYLQAIEDSRTVSVLLEKQQVSVLAERIGALLTEITRRFGAGVPEAAPGTDLDPTAEEQLRHGRFTRVHVRAYSAAGVLWWYPLRRTQT